MKELIRDLTSSFGTGCTLWYAAPSEAAPLAVLFHGVHSTCRPGPGSKYALAARLLNQAGFATALCETSRLQTDDALPPAAFEGKTFAQEMDDFRALAACAEQLHGSGADVLWGFSLGGVAAALCALQTPNCLLVQAGTGMRPRRERENLLTLPILSTLPPASEIGRTAAEARPRRALGFWGTEDKTFDEQACRDAFAALTCSDKTFEVCPGADHGFRRHCGEEDPRWIHHLTAQVIAAASHPAHKKGTKGKA